MTSPIASTIGAVLILVGLAEVFAFLSHFRARYYIGTLGLALVTGGVMFFVEKPVRLPVFYATLGLVVLSVVLAGLEVRRKVAEIQLQRRAMERELEEYAQQILEQARKKQEETGK